MVPSARSGVGLHGLILVAYKRFLQDRFGSALAAEVVGAQRLQPRELYPDALFQQLVDDGAARANRSREHLLREFGAHAVGTFFELYPAYFPPEGARRFLTQLEEIIQARVRETLAGAAPPPLELSVRDCGGGRIEIRYRSRRNLCSMLAGLLDGTGTHYQTPVRHVQQTCARNGDPECMFVVEVQQTLLPRTVKKPKP